MLKPKPRIVFLSFLALILAFSMTTWAEETEKININTAAVEELVKMKRVGPKTAAKIIEYREANGPFEKPEDLMNVQGIGEKIFEEIKDIITIE